MRTASGTSSSPSSSLPISAATPSANPSSSSDPSDTPTSFEDVLQQHGGHSSKKGDAKVSSNLATVPTKPANPLATTPANPAPLAPPIPNPRLLKSFPALTTPLMQGQPTPAPVAATPVLPDPTADAPVASVPVTPKTPTPPTTTDLASMIIAAALNAKTTTPAPVTPETHSGKDTTTHSKSDKDSTSAPAPQPSTPFDITAMLAQAAGMTATTQQAAAKTPAPATESDFLAAGNAISSDAKDDDASPVAPTEKKSAPANGKGSFIQFGSQAATSASTLFGLLAGSAAQGTLASDGTSLTPNSSRNNSIPASPAAGPLASLGTANVEKERPMNANLNLPEISSGYGLYTIPQQHTADIHVVLNSNDEFTDALRQVMHAAALTPASEFHTPTPTRVAIEIQTPPGAVVNVYVSRQDDQFRAQLSTNDPQALKWVQDQMSSLRQTNDFGVEVRWLPPQIETTIATTDTASEHENGYSWNGGGQGQQFNQQQPDERSQSERQRKGSLWAGLAGLTSTPFATTIDALGRAA